MDETEIQDQAGQTEAEDGLTGQIVQALEGRAAFYDMLAWIYFKPLTAEQIENIAQTDFSAYADVNEDFADGLNDMKRFLNKRHTGTRQQLAVDFTASFGGTSSWKGKYAAPYESVFTSDEGLMFQDAYHDVFQLYRRNRVQRAEGYDYPDDHLSFMCEFMVILSQRAIDALQAGDTAYALEQVETARGFLEDHILSWYDRMADVALLLVKTRFYRGIVKISRGFFAFDRELLADIADALAPEQPEEAAETAEAADEA